MYFEVVILTGNGVIFNSVDVLKAFPFISTAEQTSVTLQTIYAFLERRRNSIMSIQCDIIDRISFVICSFVFVLSCYRHQHFSLMKDNSLKRKRKKQIIKKKKRKASHCESRALYRCRGFKQPRARWMMCLQMSCQTFRVGSLWPFGVLGLRA